MLFVVVALMLGFLGVGVGQVEAAIECPANMDFQLDETCLCSEGWNDCDGDEANGCEIEGYCFDCSSDNDCGWCGSTCNSGIPAGEMCIQSIKMDWCGCIEGKCVSGDSICDKNTRYAEGECSCKEPRGDYDESGGVDIFDLFGWYEGYKSDDYESFEEADFDCNGEVNVFDLIAWYESYKRVPEPSVIPSPLVTDTPIPTATITNTPTPTNTPVPTATPTLFNCRRLGGVCVDSIEECVEGNDVPASDCTFCCLQLVPTVIPTNTSIPTNTPTPEVIRCNGECISIREACGGQILENSDCVIGYKCCLDGRYEEMN